MKIYRYSEIVHKLKNNRFVSDTNKYLKNLFSRPNKKALLVFGFQKSGTTVIAALLAEKAGLSATLDTHYMWRPYLSKLISGEISLAKHINSYSHPFSKDVIKEPNLTYFIDDLKNIFEMKKYIMIIRNPFDTIRSILNSLYLPGDSSIININKVPYYWQYLLSGNKDDNYIEVLAKRWVEIYERIDVIENADCILIRYEEFNKNKEGFISDLLNDLGRQEKNSISHLLDKPFQRKGHSNFKLIDFFGKKNYQTINSICGDLMKHYGYEAPE